MRKSVKKREPARRGQWWWEASTVFLAGCQQHLSMADVVNHKLGIFSVPVPLSFLLKLLGFCVVCWNGVCEEGNAVLWNLVLSDLGKARSHSLRATYAKSGTATLTDNILSF